MRNACGISISKFLFHSLNRLLWKEVNGVRSKRSLVPMTHSGDHSIFELNNETPHVNFRENNVLKI